MEKKLNLAHIQKQLNAKRALLKYYYNRNSNKINTIENNIQSLENQNRSLIIYSDVTRNNKKEVIVHGLATTAIVALCALCFMAVSSINPGAASLLSILLNVSKVTVIGLGLFSIAEHIAFKNDYSKKRETIAIKHDQLIYENKKKINEYFYEKKKLIKDNEKLKEDIIEIEQIINNNDKTVIKNSIKNNKSFDSDIYISKNKTKIHIKQ